MILQSYLKSIVRYLSRDKGYLFINTLSLSIGFACCLFIFRFIKDETSYDRFHVAAERIYRLEQDLVSQDGVSVRYANLQGAALPPWLDTISGIEEITRFTTFPKMNVEVEGEIFTEKNVIAADSTFFDLFTFEFIEGSRSDALANPGEVVITSSIARKYFGNGSPLGQTLNLRYQGVTALLTVSGVINDVPSNSHFMFDIVASPSIYEKLFGNSISEAYLGYNYLKTSNGSSAADIEQSINERYNQTLSVDNKRTLTYFLQPLTAIHLYSDARGELSANGDATYIYLFFFVAAIILIIACLNFATLTSSRSQKRSRELGIRKIFGANRGSLMAGLFAEGIVLAMAGLFIAYALVWTLLPYFNEFVGKNFSFIEFLSPTFVLLSAGLIFVVGIFAELYPALVLSQQDPHRLLKLKSIQGKGIWQNAVGIQFAITLVLISVTHVIQKQVNFISEKDLGFNRERIISFPNYFDDNLQLFVDRLNQDPNIEQTTVLSYIPGISKTSGTAVIKLDESSTPVTFDWIATDYDFLDFYNIGLTEGRNFSEQFVTDSTAAFLINETAVRLAGWEEPIGKRINAFEREGYVVGVIEDFNFLSLYNTIAPLIVVIYDDLNFNIAARYRSEDQLQATLSYAEEIWNELLPGFAFTYNFWDDQFETLYESEQRARLLLLIFTSLAIVVAALGLFNFTSYAVQQRQKEIGIRKVLGGSLYDILKVFATDYLRLFGIVSLISIPIAYYLIIKWLRDFSYKTSVGIDAIVVPISILLIVVILAAGYKIVQGALRNPVETINSE